MTLRCTRPAAKTFLLLAFHALVFHAGATAAETRMLGEPSLAAEHLAFVYAGDIWVARRDGSEPRRLTSSVAEERSPHFSPDGRWIAYQGNYDGNRDVYMIAAEGGQPRRLTWHPGDDVPIGWAADGNAVAFVSRRETDHGRSAQLYHVDTDGGYPRRQMQARVYRGSWHADGKHFAYIPHGSGYNGLFGGAAGWKGYRGGTTPAIHVMDTENDSVTVVPGAGATNFNPLWVGDTLYFLSDRDDRRFQLFRYDAADAGVTRVSAENDWDILSAAAYGDRIVYAAGGRLHELALATGEVSPLAIHVQPDLPQLRPTWKSAAETIERIGISPTGQRAVITARGEVFTVPIDEGSTRNLTGTDGRREYHGLWSPQGTTVAYVVESLDGQRLLLEDQTGAGAVREFALGPHFYTLLAWSPDAAHIVFQDNHLGLFVLATADGAIRRIDSNARRETFDVSFSPDSRWLAYTREGANFFRDLMLFDVDSGQRDAVTDGGVDAAAPAFSRDGRYLFFAGSTNSGPQQVGLNMTSQERPYRAALYAAVLAADGDSPLLPDTGDEAPASAEDGETAGTEATSDDGGETPAPVTDIDTAGLPARIVGLPVAKQNYDSLAVADDGNLYYVARVQPGATLPPPGGSPEEGNALLRFNFEEREVQSLLSGISGYVLSAGGKQLLLRNSDDSLATAEIGDKLEPKPLDLDGLRLRIDPRREWAQIFDEAWRMEREFFYAKNMHGVDWDAVYDRYRPLLEHVGRREDLNALLVQMIAELQVGHNNVGGGDVADGGSTRTGLLGANVTVEDGRYRLTRVYTGEAWNPFLAGPLAVPGNAARSGEFILAIDGEPLTGDDNLFERLQGTVGRQVTLRVGPASDGSDARDILVEPVDDERMLRLWHWVETNRQTVQAATGGRVGYVYLPNTADAGYTFFNRMFHQQIDREALIIDERSNSGGQAANYITEVLSRRHLSGWKDRDGLIFNTPASALHGPKLMLIDQDAGSGGDYLPYAFRELGIGTLMGTRTWGGLIGIAVNPRLIDGGRLTVPYFRFFDPQGRWRIENEGVAPDITVTLDPIASNRGEDTQLQRAIEEILRQLDDYQNEVPTQAPPLPEEPGR